jgi:AraC-like DNA-binding protein/quercetin dioxygenase-like cupin family protein
MNDRIIEVEASFPKTSIADFQLQVLSDIPLWQYNLNSPFVVIIEKCKPARKHFEAHLFSLNEQLVGIYKDAAFDTLTKVPHHTHSFIEIMYVISGNVTNHIEDQTFTYGSGQCCIMNKNIHHHEGLGNDFQSLYLIMKHEYIMELFREFEDPEPASSFAQKDNPIRLIEEDGALGKHQFDKIYLDCFPLINDTDKQKLFYPLIDSIVSEFANIRPGSFFQLKSLMTRFISYLTDPELYSIDRIQSDADNQDFLFSRFAHIMKSTNGRCTREELSRQLHYSGEHLNRIVKKYCGKTIKEYGRDIYLNQAKKLLTDTNISASDIVTTLGFSNRSHFYRTFKNEFHETPLEYRERMTKSIRVKQV